MSQHMYEEDIRLEILNGKVVAMSPRPTTNHNEIISNIITIFKQYLRGRRCRAFCDGVDVVLTSKDKVIPDVMIVCNPDIIKTDAIHGTPDLIVEILSPSTMKNDRGYKKNLYERCGVKEYWIIEPETKSIEVYLLKDGKYDLDNTYAIYPDYLLAKMTSDEKSDYVTEFKTSLYDDLIIRLDYVFENLI